MFSQRWCYQFALGALCFNVLLSHASALTVEYCSSLNTASTAKNSSIYQSNGLCHDFCLSSYAFAIVQEDGCWCSDYAPGTTTTGCDYSCPGYPPDMCGGNDLYGYIALNVAPSGTEGASSVAASTSSTSPTSAAVEVTVTATPQAVTIVETPTTASESSTSSSSSSSSTPDTSTTPLTTSSQTSSSSSSTWTPTPVTSLETVTGQVRTVTVTPTTPPNAGSAVGITQGKKSSSGLSTGAAVGLTIGLVALAAIVCAIIFFCVRKHRQEKQAEEYNNMSRRGSSAGLGSSGGLGPSRTMSQSSRFVLNTDGRQVVETWEPGDNTPGLRSSRLMPVDPRLDPFAAVYQRGENKSRESINTIRDDHDYSRRVAGPGPILRATNPDHPEN